MSKLLTWIALMVSYQCLALEPAPDNSPVDVVTFQLRSLQENSNGQGIANAYVFASPANKRVTGPIARFSLLFDHYRYQPMLNHQSATVTLKNSNENHAEVLAEVIDLNGSVHQYSFILSRQLRGEFTDCWMTDSVQWDPRPGKSAGNIFKNPHPSNGIYSTHG